MTLSDFEMHWLPELLTMWRASFEAGVGVRDPHSIAEQQQYFVGEVLPGQRVRIALEGGQLVGFVAASVDSVSQLYVRVGCWRQGIGASMLGWAKAQSGGSLWLYTFRRNARACAFYEKQGFVAVAHGFEPSWQLDDVKYRWTASAAPQEYDRAAT